MIDVDWTLPITELGEHAVNQSPACVSINSTRVGVSDKTPIPLGGRLMDARPVEANE